MSIASAGAATRSILARIAVTAPVISSTVSPRTRKSHQEAAHLRGRHVARQHGVERGGGLGAGQLGAGGDLGDQRLERFHGAAASVRLAARVR